MKAIYAVIGVCLLAISVALASAGLPEPTDSRELQSELGIMSKVLEQSLNESGLKNWHRTTFSTSAFEPKIRGQYLPTVGAVFTIPVNFPLAEAAETEEPPEVDESGLDLWDRSARGIQKQTRALSWNPGGVPT